jgi:hypothetical protein
VWLAAAALGTRCLFEPVMVPYYIVPMLALALVAGSSRGWTRWLLACGAGLGLTIMVDSHSSVWTYWFEMSGFIAAFLGLTWPSSAPKATSPPTSEATLISGEVEGDGTLSSVGSGALGSYDR